MKSKAKTERNKRGGSSGAARGSGYIMRENLMHALHVAIEANQRYGCGFTGETLGWQQVLNDLKNGRTVEVRG